MNRFGLAVISLALVFALATGVEAQVKTGGKNESARAITISGSLDFTFVHRSEGINEVLENEHQRIRAGGGNISGSEGFAEDDNFLQVYFKLRFDVELAEKVAAVIELENRTLTDNVTAAAVTGVGGEGMAGGSGSSSNNSLIGGQSNFGVFLGQAFIEVKEFLWQQLSFKLGIQDHRYDLRGNGNAFFMDIRESELAYMSPLPEAFAGNVYYGHEVPISIANNHSLESGAGNNNNGVFRDKDRDAGGLKFTYNLDDNLFVDFFWFQALETSAGANIDSALAVGAGDNEDRFDEYTIGFNVDYNIDEKSLFNFIYAGIYGDDGHSNIHTVGFGLDYYVTPELEAYIEFYGQWGDYGAVSVEDTVGIPDDTQEIEHEAYAGIVGFKYTFDHEIKPWIDIHYTYISGDSGDISTNGTTQSPNTNHDFVSYEDNDATMILEENHFGLDLDSNYWKIQGDMGFTVSLDRQDDFHVMTTLAWAELNHLPTRRGIAPPGSAGANGLWGNDDNGSDDDDDDDHTELGLEWDVKMTWNYTESLDFNIGFAMLFSGDDAFFERDEDTGRRASTGGPGLGVSDGFSVSDGEELWLLTVDTKLRF